MKNKNILIIVTGSIAAYKTCEVVRMLRKEGAQVQVMMTKSSEKFIGNLAQEKGLSKEEVEQEFFDKVRPTCLLERFATTDEVATFVTYLSSPLAAANNGAALRVDGGTIPTIL